jgi:hypothetical protein
MNGTNLKTRMELNRANAVKREPSVREVALYTADMMLELRQMSKSAGLATLQALIELVYYEAYATANPVAISAGDLEHLQLLEAQAARNIGTG